MNEDLHNEINELKRRLDAHALKSNKHDPDWAPGLLRDIGEAKRSVRHTVENLNDLLTGAGFESEVGAETAHLEVERERLQQVCRDLRDDKERELKARDERYEALVRVAGRETDRSKLLETVLSVAAVAAVGGLAAHLRPKTFSERLAALFKG